MWFDTHCHIYETIPSEDGAIERAVIGGVTGIVVLGTDVETSRAAIETASRDNVWAGAALHPSAVKGYEPSWVEPIEDLLGDQNVVAVGETGIDLYWDTTYLDDQIASFEAHIELAKRFDRALVIHTRSSVDETLDVLVRVGAPQRTVFHCWSGTGTQLQRALELGAYVSFAGNVSFKNSGDLRAVVKDVPQDRLLVETDSPYLTPEPNRGQENEPAFVSHVGRAVAHARGERAEDVAAYTTENALRFFGLGS